MPEPRARWFASGNFATGFVAMGNIVTGFIAIGNIARGFIAIGNVAIGVFAFGNVGIGVVSGAGATVGIGLLAAGGVVALPLISGFTRLVNLADITPLLGVLPVLGWAVASYLFPGRRAPRPGPYITALAALERGDVDEGWVRGRLESAGSGDGSINVGRDPAFAGPSISLRIGRRTLEIAAAPEARVAMERLSGTRPRVVALLRAEERVRPHEGGYRQGTERERVLACADVAAAPAPVMPWIDAGEVQWWLARAMRAGAVTGTIALVARAIVGP